MLPALGPLQAQALWEHLGKGKNVKEILIPRSKDEWYSIKSKNGPVFTTVLFRN
jgi:hypothetical protein